MVTVAVSTIVASIFAIYYIGESIYEIGESVYESIPAVKEQRREEQERQWHQPRHDWDCHVDRYHQRADCADREQIRAKRREAQEEAQEEALRIARAARLEASKTIDDCHLKEKHLKSECAFIGFALASDLKVELTKKAAQLKEVGQVLLRLNITYSNDLTESLSSPTRTGRMIYYFILYESVITDRIEAERAELAAIRQRLESSVARLSHELTGRSYSRAEAMPSLDAIKEARQNIHWSKNSRFGGIMWEINNR
tara:strand:- start:141 stop:905 length:765 start_codon:yes stop_codon:yes gene_type:complete